MNKLIVQGGMGAGVSNPFLARICSLQTDVLGTVSGVAAGPVMTRILQSGDPGGHYRRALAHFPFPGVAERILAKYFVDGGIPPDQGYKPVPVFTLEPSRELIELTVAASFAFVRLAKEGHAAEVSINFLEKMQRTLIYEIFGAMLAGVDYVTMGAGITLQIPGVLDAIGRGESPSYRVTVLGSKEGTLKISFNPRDVFGEQIPKLKRPGFLPIVSTHGLAALMNDRLPAGSMQGIVVERPIAGGHNAPPRGKLVLDAQGEPVYGPRDELNSEKLRALGIPFWIGGGFASPEGLAEARALGAEGIQVGSAFALCENSGLKPVSRREMRQLAYRGELVVRTDPIASPTGYPFKVAQMAGSLSDPSVYRARERVCDLCALAMPYERADGTVGFRCPAEPVEDYRRKGGALEDTVGARCLCNGLVGAIGLGNSGEPPIFTLGDKLDFVRRLMKDEHDSYTAENVVKFVLNAL